MDISFTDRELDVMAVLWQRGSGTVNEVRDGLDDDLAHQPLAAHELHQHLGGILVVVDPVQVVVVEQRRLRRSGAEDAVRVIHDPGPEGLERQCGLRIHGSAQRIAGSTSRG